MLPEDPLLLLQNPLAGLEHATVDVSRKAKMVTLTAKRKGSVTVIHRPLKNFLTIPHLSMAYPPGGLEHATGDVPGKRKIVTFTTQSKGSVTLIDRPFNLEAM